MTAAGIIRTLACDEISVTIDGETTSEQGRHIAHIGTPVDASVLPASPYSSDGGNAADFNNYIIGYYSDSAAYLDAMQDAGITAIATAEISVVDVEAGECTVTRSIAVAGVPLAFNATGDTGA